MGNQNNSYDAYTPAKPGPSKLRIFFVVVLSVVLIAAILIGVLVERRDDFTEAEHLARVTKLAKKRYLSGSNKYTDLQVYPIYNDGDKLQYFLIELEPVGYVFVYLHYNNISCSMYSRSLDSDNFWARYAIEFGSSAIYEVKGQQFAIDNARWTELDENGETIFYYSSPYKVANALNEKLYLLKVLQEGNHGEIAAVKRDGKYLNLISMEYIDYSYKTDKLQWPIFDSGIITAPKRTFDL